VITPASIISSPVKAFVCFIKNRFNLIRGHKNPALKVHLTCTLLLLTLHGSYSQNGNAILKPGEWSASLSKDGINTYVRWVTNTSGDQLRQRRVEMVVNSSLSAIVATIKDDTEVKSWMNRVEKYYSFNIKNNYQWSNYTQFAIPWPLKNQEMVTDNLLMQDEDSRIVHIEIQGDPAMIPASGKVERIDNFMGSWDLIPLDNGEVKIEYTLFSGKRAWLPVWIIDPIIESGLCSTFDEMRKVIHDKNEARVNLDYIKD
jgi:hypothetical protein